MSDTNEPQTSIVIPGRLNIARGRLDNYLDTLRSQSPVHEFKAAHALSRAACAGMFKLGLTTECVEADAMESLTALPPTNQTLALLQSGDNDSRRAFDMLEHTSKRLHDNPKRDTVPQTCRRDVAAIVEPLTAFDAMLGDLLDNALRWPSPTFNRDISGYTVLAESCSPELDWLHSCPLSGVWTVADVLDSFLSCVRMTQDPAVVECPIEEASGLYPIPRTWCPGSPVGDGQRFEIIECCCHVQFEIIECRCHVQSLLDLRHRLARPASEDVPVVVKHVVKKKSGRPSDTDHKQDAKWASAWGSGQHASKAECAASLDTTERKLQLALDRNRKRK